MSWVYGRVFSRYLELKDSRHLRSLVAETLPNTSVTLQVFREAEERHVTLKIAGIQENFESLASAGESKGQHALAGITVKPASFGKTGVEVTAVKGGSVASRAGIQEGDIIREINRQVVKNIEDFERFTRKLDSDDRVLLLLQRGRSTMFLSIAP